MLMKPVRDEFVVAGDLTLHYVKWGEQGAPIVGIHGLTANAFCFQAVADKLAVDYQFYAYDLRGRRCRGAPLKSNPRGLLPRLAG